MERKRNNLRIAEIMHEKGLTLTDLANKIVRPTRTTISVQSLKPP